MMPKNIITVFSGLAGAFLVASYLIFLQPCPETPEQTFDVDSFQIIVQTCNGIVDDLRYDGAALLLDITANGNGHMLISIPAGLLDSQNISLPFAGYLVLVDGEEVISEETNPGSIKVDFLQETKRIEIIGTFQI